MKVKEIEKLLNLPNVAMQVPFNVPVVILPSTQTAQIVCEDGRIVISLHLAHSILAKHNKSRPF